ncbi:leucine-rich repeat domain-containing protein [Rickettsia endosymbiont of Orchestes rusci]|uniref:hypothetical protein n=1 Tax=Rickettsia endosymbiont of Orchestes rusci TaxID=3066250 RepID=UPI00313D290E
MNFDDYKNGEVLDFKGKLNDTDIPNLLEYLNKHSEITNLDLSFCRGITDESIKAIAASKNLENITNLKLTGCDKITDESIKAIAASENFRNITNLDSSLCNGITDESIKAIAASENFKNLTNLKLTSCYNITDKGLEALAVSKNFKNLTNLDLAYCDNITDEGIKFLVGSEYLKNLTDLDLFRCNITGTTIEMFVEKNPFKNIRFPISEQKLYDGLCKIRDNKDKAGFKLEEAVKDMVFNIAPADEQGNVIKYIIENSAKYHFAINSVKDEYDLVDFYTHSPKMQQFLFNHGMVPKPESKEQDPTLREMAQGQQSVHHSDAVKKTNFITNELVQSAQLSTGKLQEKAEEYKDKILPELFKDQNPLTIKLLELTEAEKKSVMEKTLGSNKIPDDQSFVQQVKEKSLNVLKSKYLSKSNGEYRSGYSTALLQYDWTEGAEKKITIPESIGLIDQLIDTANISRKDKQELCVTLLEKNPELVKEKFPEVKKVFNDSNLSLEQIKDRPELHKLLNNISEDKLSKLFNDVSGLNIDETWKEQQRFKLAKQLYVAATTYGEDNSACIQGTWSQIIDSAAEINPELLTKFTNYRDEERKREAASVTKDNIVSFVEVVVNKFKEDETIMKDDKLRDNLEDLVLGMKIINFNEPEKITIPEQQILAKVNQEFTDHIKEHLPEYGKLLPTREEYQIIINSIPSSRSAPALAAKLEQPIEKQVDNTTKSAGKQESFADRVRSRSASPQASRTR